MASYAVKDIQPNPFRHVSRYPIRKEKVAALRESIRTTGFWDNIVARGVNGKVQIAYGHHRLVALKEELGQNHKVNLIVRDLSDDVMVQMMARENMEEWGTSASVEHETIRAVVEAYAKGLIALPPPAPSPTRQSELRFAPSFVVGNSPPRGESTHPYTVTTVANFIGWLRPSGAPQDKVYEALAALELIEEGILKESDFEELTTKQAAAVVEEARKAKGRRDAAARVSQIEAERATRDAKEAERKRDEADQDRRRQEAAARDAEEATARRRAEAEVKRFAQEAREAERTRHEAEARASKARERERAFVEEGRKSATTVGRAVSDGLKTGKIGYRQAPEVAVKVDTKRGAPPPDINDFARRIAADLNAILSSGRDPHVAKLDQLVKYHDHLEDHTRRDLARTLALVGQRFFDYARRLSDEVAVPETRRLPARR